MIHDIAAPYRNPFTVGRPVNGEGRFIGREAEIQRLTGHFLFALDPDHLALVGEVRSGKTSLLQEFLRREDARLRERYALVYLDIRGDFFPGNIHAFYQQLFEHTSDALAATREVPAAVREALDALRQSPPHNLSNRINKLILQLKRNGISLLYVLDEFDHATRLFEAQPDAFGILRMLGQKGDIRMLTASRGTIREVEMDSGISSNLAGTFNPVDINLHFFSREECGQLIANAGRQARVQWGSPLVDHLFRLSGGSPYLLQGICERLFAELPAGPEEEQIAIASRVADEVFARLYESLAVRLQRTGLRQSLVDVLSGRGAEADAADVDRLKRLNYLEVHQGSLRPFSPLLPRFVLGQEAAARLDAELRNEFLESWGLRTGKVNVLVEGETDRDYLELADACHCRERGRPSQLQGLHIVPAGPGRLGGARAAACRLVTMRQVAHGQTTQVLALFDHDAIGRRTAEHLAGLGLQKNQHFLLLDPADSPVPLDGGLVDVEIEDLLSVDLLCRLAAALPHTVHRRMTDKDGIPLRFTWHGDHKGEMVGFCRQHATAVDVERLVALLRRLRKTARLPPVA
jgi:hypothetical protein